MLWFSLRRAFGRGTLLLGAGGLAMGLWLAAPQAHAQANPAASPIIAAPGSNLAATLQEALARHPQVRQRQGEREAAGFERDAAEWGRFPTAGLESEALDDGVALTARVEQPLWAGGRLSGQIDRTAAGEQVAEAALAQAQREVLLATGEAFFETLRLTDRLAVAQANETEHQRLLEMIERRVAAEISPASDAVLAASRLQRATTQRIQTQRQLAEARTALARSLGRPLTILTPPADIALIEQPLAALMDTALRLSPERARLAATREQSTADITLARAQALPTLALGYRQTFNDRENLRGDEGEVYLTLNVESGAGLSSRATVSAASARRAATQDALDDQARALRQQVESLWAEIEALDTQRGPMQAIVEGSEAMVASYLRQFRVGKKSWLDVLNAQGEKAQAYYLKTDIEMPLLLAKFRLQALTGAFRPLMRSTTLNE